MQPNRYTAPHCLEPEEENWIDGFLALALDAADGSTSLDEAITEVAEQAGNLFIQSFPNFFGWVGEELTLPHYVTALIRTEMKARLTDSVRPVDEPIAVTDLAS